MTSKKAPKLEEYMLEEREPLYKKFPELIRLIDKRAKNPQLSKRVRYAHYASDTAKCMREQYLGRIGIVPTNPMSDAVRRMGKAGMVYEEWIKEDIRRAGFWAGEEVSLRKSPPEQSVRMDVLFDMRVLRTLFKHHRIELGLMRGLPKGDELVAPCEIKSVRPYAFKGGKGNQGYKDIPMWSHYCQTQMYLLMMDLPYGFMIYVNRDDADKSAHIVYKDDDLCKLLVKRQESLDWFLENNTLPEREGSVGFGPQGGFQIGRRCGICDYVYYDYFDEIMSKGTKAEKAKVLKSLEPLPVEQLTDSMKEAMGIDDEQRVEEKEVPKAQR